MWLQEPGCYCPAMIEKGFQWLIKTTDLDASRVTCQQYCAKYSCPGRAEGGSCEAPRKGAVCTTAFGEPSHVPRSQHRIARAPSLVPLAPVYSTRQSLQLERIWRLILPLASWSYLKPLCDSPSFHEGFNAVSYSLQCPIAFACPGQL